MGRLCPGNDQSAGKRRSGKTNKGSKWLRATLAEASLAATKTKGSYLAAQYQRLRGRRGPAKAVTATGHSILTAAWHMVQNGELYNDLGGDYFTRQNPDRTTRRLIRQLEAIGHHVTLQPREAAA
jgi:transposase